MNKRLGKIIGLSLASLLLVACDQKVRNEWETKDDQFCYEIQEYDHNIHVKCFDTDKYNIGDIVEEGDES